VRLVSFYFIFALRFAAYGCFIAFVFVVYIKETLIYKCFLKADILFIVYLFINVKNPKPFKWRIWRIFYMKHVPARKRKWVKLKSYKGRRSRKARRGLA